MFHSSAQSLASGKRTLSTLKSSTAESMKLAVAPKASRNTNHKKMKKDTKMSERSNSGQRDIGSFFKFEKDKQNK